jgi:DHA2 family multidrug resistance protein
MADHSANRPLIAFVTGLSAVVVMLDITVVNVALPHVEGSLNATREQATWVLTAYVIAMAITTPLIGWVAERIGRRMLFTASMAGFTVASVACGLATSLPELIAFRVLQGVFAAAVGPLAQAILLDVTPREQHGRAMAIWAMATMLGPTLGPPLGGWLTDQFSWRWCFLINLPLGAIAVVGAWACIRDASGVVRRRLDILGYLALALAVAAFQLLLDRGPGREWYASQETWIWTGLAALGFYWFVAHSLTIDKPLFSPALAKDRNYVTASLLSFVICLLLFSSVTLVPPILQELFGYPAFDSGLSLIPRGVATILSAFVVGRLMGKVDSRLIVLSGLMFTAVGLYMMAGISPQADNRLIMTSSFIQGLGQGTFFVPVSTFAFATLAPTLRTEAAAALGLFRNLGTSMGVSLVAMVYSAGTYRSQSRIGDSVSPEAMAARALELGGAVAPGSEADLLAVARELSRQADLVAYVNTFHFMILLCALAAPLLLLLRTRRR